MIKKNNTNNISFTVHIFFTLQNHRTFHSEERMVIGQLQKKTIVLCWSISIITFGADSNALLTYPMASVRVYEYTT